jgi:hypothetical protein
LITLDNKRLIIYMVLLKEDTANEIIKIAEKNTGGYFVLKYVISKHECKCIGNRGRSRSRNGS